MKNKSPEQKKKILIGCGVAILLLCLYFAGVMQHIMTYKKATWSIPLLIACMREHGFPSGWFFAFFLMFAGTFAYFSLVYLKNNSEFDVMGRRFRMAKKRQPYGDTHFAEPEEYKDVAIVQSPEKAYGTILGQLDDTGKHLLNVKMYDNRLNPHMAVLGASGSGKTFTFTKPYCYQVVKRRESVIITDPDGGLYRDMAGYFEDNGYVVRRLDFNNLRKSDGWNCFNSLTVENAELDAQLFCQVVISNLVDDMSSIYATGPMSLLRALILYVFLDPDRPPEEKNFGEAYKLLQNPGGEDFLDSIFDESIMPEVQRPALRPYLSFKQGSPNLRGNLITNLATQLQLLQNDDVCKVLATDDIDMLLPAEQPCAYFCLFPDSHNTYKFLVSLFFSMMFIRLMRYGDEQEDGQLPIPVNFLLDEFRSIGTIPDWATKMSTVRKRDISVAMIFQDITQLQVGYEDSWSSILNNCSTIVSLGINESMTADYISKRIGETSVKVKTEQHSGQNGLFDRFMPYSTGEGKRALLAYEETFRMDKDDVLILMQNHYPILAKKYPHILHPESKKLRKIQHSEIPDLYDTEARAARRKAEEERISEYLAKHPLSEVDRTYANLCEPEPAPPTPMEALVDYIKKTASGLRKKIRAWLNGDDISKAVPTSAAVEDIALELDEEIVEAPDSSESVSVDFFCDIQTEQPSDTDELDSHAEEEKSDEGGSEQSPCDVRSESVLDIKMAGQDVASTKEKPKQNRSTQNKPNYTFRSAEACMASDKKGILPPSKKHKG